MGNEVPEKMGRTNENEIRSKISIGTESKEKVEHLSSYTGAKSPMITHETKGEIVSK